MEIIGFLAPWVLIGLVVLFIAFSGGPGKAREAYLTRGRTAFGIAIPLLYIALGVAIPAVVIASRGTREGNSNALAQKKIRDQPAYMARGKVLFEENCASCHTLSAVNARGVTGPNLDKVGKLTPERVLSAIKLGGTGQGRMPKNLLQGKDAEAVARYLSAVAGK
jgi:mono/diheme cytochrome c family protein